MRGSSPCQVSPPTPPSCAAERCGWLPKCGPITRPSGPRSTRSRPVIPGCGVLGAATIIGEASDVHRFRSKAAFARFTGTAPIPVWSGNSSRVRLNRGGNRRLNSALHMIAVTQTRGVGPGKAYVDRLMAEGKTRTEAVRLLRRRISDVVYRALKRTDATASQPSQHKMAMAA
ncbi:IS110 family transposase [Nonomuraea longispora]|uniref:IS110 family transposase n=1 Tax=Nonomuraea longispora TaxID=1848320 RepID=A0A4R4N5W9_9ACTN|nr:IS110 family transposase [Nonomuraea longispora]